MREETKWEPADGMRLRDRTTGDVVTLRRIDDQVESHPWTLENRIDRRWTGQPGSQLFQLFEPV